MSGEESDEELTLERRRELMAEGQATFNRGEFYEAHEFWEEVWMVVDDPDRRWIQGMIQIAAGLHKLVQKNVVSSEKLLRKGLGRIEDAPDQLDGVDLASLRRGATRMLTGLERGLLLNAHSVRI